jgi:hypothetical protein
MSRSAEFNEVLKVVSAWPAQQRASLAQVLIDGLINRSSEARSKLALDELVGIARGKNPVPDDLQIEQWIDEARTRKYGQ